MVQHIVVGVDGSAHAARALRCALEEARCRRASVTALLAYEPPRAYAVLEYPAPDVAIDRHALRVAAQEELERAVAAVRGPAGGVGLADVAVATEVVEGSPVGVLLEAARDADLVVVGSRGRGGFRSLLLGSTSHQLVTYATCPVMVVPARSGGDDTEEPVDDAAADDETADDETAARERWRDVAAAGPST